MQGALTERKGTTMTFRHRASVQVLPLARSEGLYAFRKTLSQLYLHETSTDESLRIVADDAACATVAVMTTTAQ